MRHVALTTLAILVSATAAAAQTRNVYINDVRIPDGRVTAMEQQYRIRIPNGRYWYDKMSGAWGLSGGPTAGFTVAGLDLGGPLQADASNGHTGVFINGRQLHMNGRQLHMTDVLGLQQLIGAVYPGRYWVDAYGNAGLEGGPALVNLVAVARSRSAQQGGAYSAYTRTGAMFGSDGNGCLVYSDRETSYTGSGC